MAGFHNTVELLKWGRSLLVESGRFPDLAWLDPFWAALAAIVAGFILALWGSRILRVVFVLTFMAVGAAFGKRIAGSIQIDLLIGLVVGAGLSGLVGYALYRWWLGLTVGALAALIMAATFSAPKLLDERPAFEDFQLAVGSGQYDTAITPLYSWESVRKYFWDRPDGRKIVYRTLGPVAVIALLGMVLGILAPRLAAILGTSTLGTLLLAAGTAGLLAVRWPDSWARLQAHEAWALGGVAFVWLFSILYQATHPARPVVQASTAPVPAATS